jgi:hypothetical protein
VALRLAPPAERRDGVTVDVVARGVAAVQGVAFRLLLEPRRVAQVEAEAGQAWSAEYVARFVRRPGGDLWAGVGHVGKWGLDATAGVVIARVRLSLADDDPVELAFGEPASVVIDPDGHPVTGLRWLGGRFERR